VRWKPILVLACLFTLIAPADGQRPNAYFSLSTNKTYLPGEKIGLRVFTNNVDALEFRIYKVNDPALFFERLDNPHDFGRVAPKERIDNPTFLERFHDWKHGVWVDIRDFFRYQFSSRSRSQLREEHQAKAKAQAGPTADVFAQVPVINSSQLVARWKQQIPPSFYSETENVPIQNLPKGLYLVEATDGQLRAYTIVIVSELGLVTKTTEGQVLTFAADRRSGAPVSGADVRFWTDKKEKAHLKSDASGLAETAVSEGQYQDVRVLAVHDDDVALVTPYSYNISSNPAEDWAETFAHYLHIRDTLDTAAAFSFAPANATYERKVLGPSSFDTTIEMWLPLSWALNMVNRSMGKQDLYPFVLPGPVLEKMRFIHTIVDEVSAHPEPQGEH